ncbi:hypothetical protein COPCOM_00173 [Coprococcus comes ATCC 27758]|uniref:Uncharacterized protein n=1 Tax=Coprococcus comes ATCC 27758 TaxID=470146 RepID=C0B4V6_9FIRM|nr:hypothetical protein COPCOM_00173 [Coprococcus comes ATCC 27758]
MPTASAAIFYFCNMSSIPLNYRSCNDVKKNLIIFESTFAMIFFIVL